jgi:endonuclease/exonuclease/phosphatase (EEP) superfamily protein YafD
MRAYSHNLRYDNPTPGLVEQAIRASEADIVMLQEVSESNEVVLDALARDYPTRVLCEFSRVGAVAVLSRYRMIGEPGCARGQGIAWARLGTPDGPVTAVSIHLPWPWPYGTQARQSQRVAAILAELEEPVVIAGDFNNAAWSHAVGQLRLATGTRATPGLRLTLQRPLVWPGLPLDHALVSEDLVAESRMLDQFGSDHHALLTQMRWRGGA